MNFYNQKCRCTELEVFLDTYVFGPYNLFVVLQVLPQKSRDGYLKSFWGRMCH